MIQYPNDCSKIPRNLRHRTPLFATEVVTSSSVERIASHTFIFDKLWNLKEIRTLIRVEFIADFI